MNKLYLLYGSIILTVVLVFFNNSMRKDVVSMENEKEISYLYFCRAYMEMQLESKDYIIPNVLCRNINKSIDLSHLVVEKPILVFRHSNLHCKSCVELSYDILDSCFFKNREDVLILYSSDFEQGGEPYRRLNKIRFNMYQIDEDAFDWQPEKYLNPYFFVLYPNMKVSDIFMPEKKYPGLTQRYIEGVKGFLMDSLNNKLNTDFR